MKVRNVKINFLKSMSQNSIRNSCRRSLSFMYQNRGKDRIWHRNVKRSIKHFEKMALNNIIQDNQQRSSRED